MLYLIAEWMNYEGLANLFRYQSFRSGAAPAPAASLMHKKRRAPSSSPRPTTPLAEDDDDSIDIELSPRYV